MGARVIGWIAIAVAGGHTGCSCDGGGAADAAAPEIDGAPAGCQDETPGAERAGNNSSFLTGLALGTGEDSIDSLRKPIAVNLTAPSSLEVGDGWAMRPFASQSVVYLAIEVNNPTGELACRIAAQPYQWRDADGDPLDTRERVFATGSVGDADPLYSHTCLGPDETGYFLDITTDEVYDQLAAVDLEISFTADGAAVPDAELFPDSYIPGADGRVVVAFDSAGTAPAIFSTDAVSWGEAVLLDDQRAPLLWTHLGEDLAPADGEVAVGAQGSVGSTLQYGGCAAAMRAFLAFTD